MTPKQRDMALALKAIDPAVSYLDSDEAFSWLNEADNDHDPVSTLAVGLRLVTDVRREKLNRLIEMMLKDITLDQMSDLRDLMRAVLIDECKWQIRDGLTALKQEALANE